jgi:hypothetical protein
MRQYVHFALTSRHISAAEITARLMVEPDEISVRGSRVATPATPACHAWTVVCRQPGLSVSEQLAQIVDRLRPYHDQIVSLSETLADQDPEYGGATLELVHYLDDGDSEGEAPSSAAARSQETADHDPLLSWARDREVLEFLLATNLSIDLDVYS